MHSKAEHLHIRASEHEKAILAQAAQVQRLSISQFVLQTMVPVAEGIVRDSSVSENIFRLSPEKWAEFHRLLDAPPREIPELRELLLSKAPWEK